MNEFDWIARDEKLQQLMRSAQAGRIVHALLFSGPRGSGKKTMADLFARAVLCQGSGDRPCDVCPACKKCLNDAHPDVHVVAPEKNIIKVDQIRGLIEKLSLSAYEGGKKIAIICRADSMNESAQNALLKTLENPMGDVLFMLLTDSPGALLPTVVSRCLQLRFRSLEIDECAEVLRRRGMDAQRAGLLSALSQGSVGRALEIDADTEYLAMRERVLHALQSLERPEDIVGATAMLADVKGREGDVLEIMELWARDLMRVQNAVAPLETQEVQKLKESRLCGSVLLQRVMGARRQLSANLSWVNVFESMGFDLVRKSPFDIREELNSWQS